MILDDIKQITGRSPGYRLIARIYSFLDILKSIYCKKFKEADVTILYRKNLELIYQDDDFMYYFHYTDDFEFVTLKILKKERVILKISDFYGSIEQMIKISDSILGLLKN